MGRVTSNRFHILTDDMYYEPYLTLVVVHLDKDFCNRNKNEVLLPRDRLKDITDMVQNTLTDTIGGVVVQAGMNNIVQGRSEDILIKRFSLRFAIGGFW